MSKSKAKKIFRGQKEGEEVIAIFHKHWISFLKPFFIWLPFFIISVLGLWYQSRLGTGFLIIGFVIFVGSTSYLLYNYLVWRWDVYILTSQRVIDINQKTLFHRVVSEATLGNIQDTTYEIKGVWQTFFNYGRVNILTASTGANINFEDVSQPQHVMDLVAEAKDIFLKNDHEKGDVMEEKLENTLDL